MKRVLCAAALPLILAACGTLQTSADAGGRLEPAKSATYYCWRDKLATQGDALHCNWEKSAAEACRSTANVALAKSALAGEPRKGRLCENGQWLVEATAR